MTKIIDPYSLLELEARSPQSGSLHQNQGVCKAVLTPENQRVLLPYLQFLRHQCSLIHSHLSASEVTLLPLFSAWQIYLPPSSWMDAYDGIQSPPRQSCTPNFVLQSHLQRPLFLVRRHLHVSRMMICYPWMAIIPPAPSTHIETGLFTDLIQPS